MLSKVYVLAIINIGLLCTISPRLYGTVIIWLAATIYGTIHQAAFIYSTVFWELLCLMVFAETASRLIPITLRKYFKISPEYSLDVTACNFAGLVIVSALLGNIVGGALWEFAIGKSLLQRSGNISAALKILSLASSLRSICGFVMFIIIICYVLT